MPERGQVLSHYRLVEKIGERGMGMWKADDTVLNRTVAVKVLPRQRRRTLGIRDGLAGSVTFVQRFGGALNLNPHFHSVLPDGLFVPRHPSGTLAFVPLPEPTPADIEALTFKIARRVSADHRTPSPRVEAIPTLVGFEPDSVMDVESRVGARRAWRGQRPG